MKRTYPAAASVSRTWSRWLVVTLAALLCLGGALSARAQGGPAGGADADPPDRVARLSEASGKVWLFSPDGSEWIAVDRNRPLTTGDRIATDNGAHAEIALGTTTLRLDAATELEIVLLDDNVFNVHLHSGSVAARLRNSQAVAEFTLDTDEGRFRPRSVGRYRFDRFDQASDLTVDSGQAAYESRNSALPLGNGQHAQFWLDASGVPQYNMLEPARDAFAAWNEERDRAQARPVATTRYVSPEMTGAEDLDRYGQWEQTPEYGAIWAPRAVAVGWAPYSTGHWAYVRPWGWTWVDDAPWGFAPFHYGRWVNYRNRWCWAPGTYVARPVYAPALVAWIGGPAVSVSISLGGGRSAPPVGWFPLAPREVYVPSYRYSPRYVRNINVTHVTNVTQITTIVNNTNGAADRRDFANRKFPHAVTVVPASVVTSRAPVQAEAARVRTDPQVRAMVADARPVAVTAAAPVAAPPPAAKPPSGKAVVTRPPFEGRPPGLAGRPGQERGQERGSGSPTPQATAAPVPPPGARNEAADGGSRGGGRGNEGRPPAANAAPSPNAAPQANVAPAPNAAPQPNAPPRPHVAPSPNAAPAPNAAAQPNGVPPPTAAPPAKVQAAPADDERGRGRRGGSEGRPGAVPPPPVAGGTTAAPPRGTEGATATTPPRANEARGNEPRPPESTRANRSFGGAEPREARGADARGGDTRAAERPVIRPLEPRPVDASRFVRPVEPAQGAEGSRTPPPRGAAPVAAKPPPPAAKPPEAKVEPAKGPPEQRSRSAEKHDPADKPDKPGDKQK